MITPLKDLRKFDLPVSSTELYFSKVKELRRRNIDLNVFLPSKNTNLQRDFVWSLLQKRQLILSVFIGRQIPHISIMSIINPEDSHNDTIQVIDGKQRLSTFIGFLDNNFSVELEGEEFYYKDLPKDYKFAIDHYVIFAQCCYEYHDRKITDSDKIEWFKRINFFGTPQELSHLKGIEE